MSWYTKIAQPDPSQIPETLEMDTDFQPESDPTAQLMNDNELLEVSEAAQIHGEIDYKLLAKTLLQKANW